LRSVPGKFSCYEELPGIVALGCLWESKNKTVVREKREREEEEELEKKVVEKKE